MRYDEECRKIKAPKWIDDSHDSRGQISEPANGQRDSDSETATATGRRETPLAYNTVL
jgi:hypothetical protein